MPSRGFKICPAMGCNIILKYPNTHCDKHKPEPFKNMRQGGRDKFYDSPAWRKTSKKFLSLYPLCKSCEDKGNTVPAKHADHIKPIEKGGDRLSFENLQPLCLKCHARKTASGDNT